MKMQRWHAIKQYVIVVIFSIGKEGERYKCFLHQNKSSEDEYLPFGLIKTRKYKQNSIEI